MDVNGLRSYVAEGGESCLTSGDRREPEENGPLSNIPLPPRSAKPSEGEEFFIYTSLLHVAEGGDAPKQNYTSIIQTINYTFIIRILKCQHLTDNPQLVSLQISDEPLLYAIKY